MSKVVFEAVHALRKYTANDGTEKTVWRQCGVIFKSEKGSYTLKLDYVPTKRNEEGELWINLFVPQKREQKPAPPQQEGFRETPPPSNDGFGPDIPF